LKMITKERLERLYNKGLSMMEIATKIGISNSGVKYLAEKYNIPRRSRSEANYLKYNPKGDPFKIKRLKTRKDVELFNLGIGLFLGEGTKKNKFNVALANSDPQILRLFLKFLREICRVEGRKIKAALNIFNDIDSKEAVDFWSKLTKIPINQVKTITIRKSKGGTYKNKSRWGTLTVYVPNVKLKAIMNEWCKNALNI
jgi:hypothetical protein